MRALRLQVPIGDRKPSMASFEWITFSSGFVADWAVVQRLLDIESRGCQFTLEPAGRFRVSPPDKLTPEDIAFLRARRDEARACIKYTERIAESPT